jgi:hypothetical protein
VYLPLDHRAEQPGQLRAGGLIRQVTASRAYQDSLGLVQQLRG